MNGILLGLCMLLASAAFVASLIFGIEYYCHVTFTKKYAIKNQCTVKNASMDDLEFELGRNKLAKLSNDLFVAEKSNVLKIQLDNWTVRFHSQMLLFGPIDYIRYRILLKSDRMQNIEVPDYWKKFMER